DEMSPDELPSESPGPDDRLASIELGDRLRSAIAALPTTQAEIFVMRYLEQLSYQEIADKTESNRNAIGVMLNRAKQSLRKKLTDSVEIDGVTRHRSESSNQEPLR
ncbi:MAG: sigma-70 family RNA polymerase sigma factor, partial [Planctomycetota bacterium]